MYSLGSTTLPDPVSFNREYIETSATNLALTGRTTKDIRNRKERFTLSWERLTPTEVASILSEYTPEITKNFSVTETNLTIASTAVHIDISKRDYVKGGEYRSDMTMTLTEVV
jgi:hypothetical protein